VRIRLLRVAASIEKLAKGQHAPWRDFLIIPAQEFLKAVIGERGLERFSQLSYQAALDKANDLKQDHKINPRQYSELVRCIHYAQIQVHESARVGSLKGK
jgi:uncharacterized protein YutE (UPF0331/DUF86 family)